MVIASMEMMIMMISMLLLVLMIMIMMTSILILILMFLSAGEPGIASCLPRSGHTVEFITCWLR